MLTERAPATRYDVITRRAGKPGVNCGPEVSEKARESRYGHVIDAVAGDSDDVGGGRRDFVIVTESLGHRGRTRLAGSGSSQSIGRTVGQSAV